MIPKLAILDYFSGEDDELMLGRNFGPQIAAKDFHPQNGMRRLEDAELETFGGSSSNIPAGCRHPKPTAASQGDNLPIMGLSKNVGPHSSLMVSRVMSCSPCLPKSCS